MVVKIHIDLSTGRRLIVLGRDVDFWDPDESSGFYEAGYEADY